MLSLQTYAGLSLVGTLAVIYYAFNSRGQFYPATVYLSTSKISLVFLLNMGFVCMCILWHFTKRLFLGSLRESEIERLNEQIWRESMEILFAITIFRQDFSVPFIAMVITLLFVKSLHWLSQKRLEYMETTPAVTRLAHVRIVSFFGFLLLIDALFLYNAVKTLLPVGYPSVSLFFAFEYMILATATVATSVKYIFYVYDMLMEGQWESKATFTFYLELIRDLLHLSLYLCFFFVIFVNYGVPLHLIRELYETFRNFKARVADYIRYRRITSNMNERFPDATPEELNASDATCIICREEMITAKKLICGHLFHVHCLRSWLERQHTCPTCRALVVPSENGSATGGRHGIRSVAQHQATHTNNASNQSSTSSARAGISQHHTRLQAAAAAASVYQKSCVYPSANPSVWSQGYSFLPQMHGFSPASGNAELNGERTVSEQLQQNQFLVLGGHTNFAFPQVPYFSAPSQTSNTNLTHVDKSGSDPDRPVSQLEDQEMSIRNQIEILQNQLQNLHQQTPENVTDNKGKATASSSVSDSIPHAEVEQQNKT